MWFVIPLPPQSPEVSILIGMLVAAILGYITGVVAIRRQGIYFAMITLALAQMMYFFALQAKFTGGEDGIQGVPRGRLFGTFDLSDEKTMYVFVLVVFLAGFLLIYRIINSPFGEVLKAIRENEQRADFARLQDRALQARRLRAVGDAGGPRRVDEFAWSFSSPR